MLQFNRILTNATLRLTSTRMTWYRITQQLLYSTLSDRKTVQVSQIETPSNISAGKKQKKTISITLNDLKSDNEEKYEQEFTMFSNLIKDKFDRATVDNKNFVNLLNNILEYYTPECKQKKDGTKETSQHLNPFDTTHHLNEFVKMLKVIAVNKCRNLPVIKCIADTIAKSSFKLNLFQAADVLYSLVILNFYHEDLLKRIHVDIRGSILRSTQYKAIKSIIVSLGKLQYKDPVILDELSAWIVNHRQSVKNEIIVNFMMTLAILNYIPSNGDELIQNHIAKLEATDMVQFEKWLNLVWSLTILDRVSVKQLSSVLNEQFVNIIKDLQIPVKQKLLNINAAAKLLCNDYNGPYVNENDAIFKCDLVNRADKVSLINSMLDPLKSLVPTTANILTNVNYGMGFLIDIECKLDEKCYRTLLPKSQISVTEPIVLAFILQSYFDFTKGDQGLTGFHLFQCKLLESKGFKVIPISTLEYNVEDKLVTRLKYLKSLMLKVLEQH